MEHPRTELHTKAKHLIAQEDFQAAIELLQKGYENFGAHVLLLIDLASIYLQTGDYQNFLKYTFLTHEEMGNSKTKLSADTLLRASLELGVLMKTAGHPSEALQLFEDSLALAKKESKTNQDIQSIRIQYLKLICEFNLRVNVAKQYLFCEDITASDIKTEVQLQIALMEADFLLFGMQMAMARVRQVLKDHTIEATERKTVLFAFLACVLRNNQATSLPFNFLSGVNYFECTAYQKNLWDLYLHDLSETPFRSIRLSRSEGLNTIDAVQYLYLLHQRESLEETSEAARKKLIYLLQALSDDSRAFIMEQWPLKSSKEAKILFVEDNLLIVDGSSSKLPHNSELVMLLNLFTNQRRVSVEQILYHLYQAEFSVISFDRLRLTVARANRNLEKVVGVKNLFILNDSGLLLNQFFSIQRRM